MNPGARRAGLAVALAAGVFIHEESAMASGKQVFRAGPDFGLPFSTAVRAGDLVYVSGVLSTDASGKLVTDDIRAQARRTLDNLRASFEAAGTKLENAAAINVYLTNPADFQAMNEVYRTYWPKDPPTRTTVVTGLAAPGALIEIAGVAVRQGAERLVVHPKAWKQSPNPYSYGIRTGDTLFLSGLVPRNLRENALVAGDIGVQTRAVLEHAREILEAGGMSFADVVSARVYITDTADFPGMNEAYRKYFLADPPARATVKAALTSTDFKVEITLVAVKSAARRVFATQPNPQPQPQRGRARRRPPLCRRHARQQRIEPGRRPRASPRDLRPHRPHADRRRLRMGRRRGRSRVPDRRQGFPRPERGLSRGVQAGLPHPRHGADRPGRARWAGGDHVRGVEVTRTASAARRACERWRRSCATTTRNAESTL